MCYDFDREIDRRNTDSLKWDVAEGELPMWVADMDFETAPEVRAALLRRAEHGVFGYSIVPQKWYRAYQDWWEKRHGLQLPGEWLIFCTGVIPAISTAVRKLTTPGEKVLLQTPVYNTFVNSIVNNGRFVAECPLSWKEGQYEIDFAQLEKALSDPQVSMMILCNPHNPIGKIWDRETLEQIGELCFRYHVTVLSDEIHCDLTAPGKEYIPFAGVSEHCRQISVTAVAPTKAFNLAGLQTAAVIVPDELLRHRMWRALNTDEVAEPNAFAVDAAVAAFTEGGAWLDALRSYLQENKIFVKEFLEKEIPELQVVSVDVTYLLWIDCSRLTDDTAQLAAGIRRETGLYLQEGSVYGGNGRSFLRMNIATTRKNVQDGLHRLKRALQETDAFLFGRNRV